MKLITTLEILFHKHKRKPKQKNIFYGNVQEPELPIIKFK